MKKIILAATVMTLVPLAAFAEEDNRWNNSLGYTPDAAPAAEAPATEAAPATETKSAEVAFDEATCASAMAKELISASAKKDLVVDAIAPKVQVTPEKANAGWVDKLKLQGLRALEKTAKSTGLFNGAFNLSAHDGSGVKYSGQIYVRLVKVVSPGNGNIQRVLCSLKAIPAGANQLVSSFDLTAEKSNKPAVEVNASEKDQLVAIEGK